MDSWLDEKRQPEARGGWIYGDATILTHSENGEMAGIICLGIYGHESERGATLWIRELAVHPDYQRRGIATKLLRQGLGYGASARRKARFLSGGRTKRRGAQGI